MAPKRLASNLPDDDIIRYLPRSQNPAGLTATQFCHGAVRASFYKATSQEGAVADQFLRPRNSDVNAAANACFASMKGEDPEETLPTTP